jgi:predicted transcriptional regulator
MSHSGEQMSTEKLTAEIKTRVPKEVKKAFEKIAADRHLDVADIAREAYREYLKKQEEQQAHAA